MPMPMQNIELSMRSKQRTLTNYSSIPDEQSSSDDPIPPARTALEVRAPGILLVYRVLPTAILWPVTPVFRRYRRVQARHENEPTWTLNRYFHRSEVNRACEPLVKVRADQWDICWKMTWTMPTALRSIGRMALGRCHYCKVVGISILEGLPNVANRTDVRSCLSAFKVQIFALTWPMKLGPELLRLLSIKYVCTVQ
jgi:hypothetical protein